MRSFNRKTQFVLLATRWMAEGEKLTLGHKMKNDILSGISPSAVLRSLIYENPSLTNSDLSNLLRNEFVSLDSHAAQLVWHWKGPGRLQGLSDENLDGYLMKYLKEAKYL